MPVETRLAIGLDVGGSKIIGGIVDRSGVVKDRVDALPTPSTDQRSVVLVLLEVVRALRSRHPEVDAIGIGTAGLVDWPEGGIRWAPNNAFHQLPLRRLIAEATGLPTVVDNDANTAAWGEAHYRGGSTMALITVGTGVGAGLVLNGVLYRGHSGIAAEVGHIAVDPTGGEVCACGNIGCLEAVASGTALGQLGRRAAAAAPDGAIARMVGPSGQVTGETVHLAALAGDPTARRLFTTVGSWLGVGIATLVNVLDLELVVVGGGIASADAADDLIMEPTRAAFGRFLFARDHRAPTAISLARLGQDAGWIGAGLLALDVQSGRGGDRLAAALDPVAVRRAS